MAVPDTTPVTGVPPASPIPTVTFPTSPAPTAALLTTVVRSARPVNPTRIAVRRRFPVTTDVPQPTPAVSVPLVRATRIVMCPINLVTADALPQTPVANALPASPARLRILVPAFPAALTPTAPVALATATPGMRAMQIPDVLKWIPVSAAEAALALDKPLAALLLRYRPLLVKTVPARHTTLVALKLVLSKAKKIVTVLASALPNAAADAQVVTPVKMEYAKKSVLLLPVQLQYFVLQPVAVKYILLRQTAVQIPFVLTANQLQTKMKNASPLPNNGVLLMVLLT